jgi:hypothetical protein
MFALCGTVTKVTTNWGMSTEGETASFCHTLQLLQKKCPCGVSVLVVA